MYGLVEQQMVAHIKNTAIGCGNKRIARVTE
jgi:hypothetical protein